MKQIPVIYQDGMMDLVEPRQLQRLIDKEWVAKFHRSGGWVHLGIDPVRGFARADYNGQERRGGA